MCRCHIQGSCHGCHHAVDRRRFLQGLGGGAAATLGGLAVAPTVRADEAKKKIRVAAVFLSGMNTREIWPYPGFDTDARQQEVLAALSNGCPGIEFVPVKVEKPDQLRQAIDMKSEVDGYLVYVMTLVWSQNQSVSQIAQLGKPMLVADEFLGGCGIFLQTCAGLSRRKLPVAAVSTTRIEDLMVVARQFGDLREPDVTPAVFAQRCEETYRKTFPATGELSCAADKLPDVDIGECVKRFQDSSFLVVGSGRPGRERDFLGVRGRYIDFGELGKLFEEVDEDEAAEWADRWAGRSTELPAGEYVEPRQPTAEAIRKAAGIYLATKELLKKYDTENITMNCLGGFAAGKLPAYPCLGFMQILDDGGQGVCEAMPDDTLSMLIARLVTGRPGFVSDPAIDTSKNQVVYAHCVATTKPFGPDSESNSMRIRTLHNRDPRGACAESMLPAGYMTTTFRTNAARKQLVYHRAKTVGTLDSEKGCRTKLIGEVAGDIGKLFDQWDRFGWHRVTVYGDIHEPLTEFGKALGLEVIEEA
jgi:hypothetical protein